MNSETEVYLPSMRGTAFTVGKRTHILLRPKWRPRWSDHMQPESEAPTLGCGLIGFVAFEETVRTGR